MLLSVAGYFGLPRFCFLWYWMWETIVEGAKSGSGGSIAGFSGKMGISYEVGRDLAFVKNGEIIVKNGVGMKWEKMR